ncbi:MAG: class I SAM-dependent methyltransferase [Deltaproteobacteria bacterium]|nr:class I SAM-dependent methyltransferase [Deltaproteobacteria bacterium]
MDTAAYVTALLDAAAAVPFDVPAALADRLAEHQALVDKWAQRINLTTVTEPKEAAVKHGLDCLLFTALIPEGDTGLTVDVGSGGGFPWADPRPGPARAPAGAPRTHPEAGLVPADRRRAPPARQRPGGGGEAGGPPGRRDPLAGAPDRLPRHHPAPGAGLGGRAPPRPGRSAGAHRGGRRARPRRAHRGGGGRGPETRVTPDLSALGRNHPRPRPARQGRVTAGQTD